MKTVDLDQILKANAFADLFTEGTRKELRHLLKYTHPDLHPSDESKAQKAFIHVNLIWKLKDSPNATVAAGDTTPPNDAANESTLHTKKHTYENLNLIRSNGGVKTFTATVEESGKTVTLLIASNPKVGNHLQEGVKTMKSLKTEIPENFKEFFPDTIDAFQIQQDGKKLFGVTQTWGNTFYTLREVLEDYPEGISGRDVAWMFRRMLVSVGNTHDSGYAHGGLDLDAFIIEPATHRLLLTNWQYAVSLGSEVNMVTKDTKAWYTDADSENTLATRQGKTVTPTRPGKVTSVEKELQMLGFMASSLLQAKAPARLVRFFNAVVSYPTGTASEILGDFDYILKEVYGDRVFHEFKMKRTR